MNKNNNNNIEDFFKHTIEDFNDAPSDKVWEGLEHRLEPPAASVFNNKLLLPFFMICLVLISGFSVISNISLQQKTEKLVAQIQEEEYKRKNLHKYYSVANKKYLDVSASLDICKSTLNASNIEFSQDIPLRDEDIITMREL